MDLPHRQHPEPHVGPRSRGSAQQRELGYGALRVRGRGGEPHPHRALAPHPVEAVEEAEVGPRRILVAHRPDRVRTATEIAFAEVLVETARNYQAEVAGGGG